MINPESTRPTCLFLTNIKQRLSIVAQNSTSTNLCLPYWKRQGISFGWENGHPEPTGVV